MAAAMVAASLRERAAAAKADIERLKGEIERRKAALANGGLSSLSPERRPLGPPLRKRRTLLGHFSKVYALDWAGDAERVASAR